MGHKKYLGYSISRARTAVCGVWVNVYHEDNEGQLWKTWHEGNRLMNRWDVPIGEEKIKIIDEVINIIKNPLPSSPYKTDSTISNCQLLI